MSIISFALVVMRANDIMLTGQYLFATAKLMMPILLFLFLLSIRVSVGFLWIRVCFGVRFSRVKFTSCQFGN